MQFLVLGFTILVLVLRFSPFRLLRDADCSGECELEEEIVPRGQCFEGARAGVRGLLSAKEGAKEGKEALEGVGTRALAAMP